MRNRSEGARRFREAFGVRAAYQRRRKVTRLTRGAFDFIQRRRVFQRGCVAEFFAEIGSAHDAAHHFCVSRFGYVADEQQLRWERALCQVGRRTRFLNCERFERRYAARNDGFFASRRRRKCAQSNRVAASAVSVSALRRELPRSHKHRVCDAWNERRPGFKRFSVWHGQRNFFIGYFALQIPGALLVERWSARLLLATTLIIWGALTTLTGFVRTPLELYGARFLLGAAEAGFFPV